jgi:hypothetical protein
MHDFLDSRFAALAELGLDTSDPEELLAFWMISFLSSRLVELGDRIDKLPRQLVRRCLNCGTAVAVSPDVTRCPHCG